MPTVTVSPINPVAPAVVDVDLTGFKKGQHVGIFLDGASVAYARVGSKGALHEAGVYVAKAGPHAVTVNGYGTTTVLASTSFTALAIAPPPPVVVPPPVTGIPVPSSIDATGATDATGALQAFVNGVPNGSVIAFKSNARYQLSQGIQLDNRTGLTFEGNGATLLCSGSAIRDSAFVLGWGAGNNRDIKIRNFVMQSDLPETLTVRQYHVGQESSEGVAVYRNVDGLEISGNTIRDFWGHAVYLASGGHVGERASNVHIHNNLIERMGVMGIAIATDLVIEDNTINDTALYPIDFEDGVAGELMLRVKVQRNAINRWTWHATYTPHCIVGDGGTGMTWDDILIADNVMTGGSQVKTLEGNTDGLISFWGSDRKTNLRVTGNRGPSIPGWAYRFNNVAGLTVSGNTQPIPAGGEFAHIINSSGVSVA